jgi:putative membrane protein
VPLARMQSVARTVGPIERMLRLASVRIHTVAGPVSAALPIIDQAEVESLFERLADEAVERATADTSHHWGAVAGASASSAPTTGQGDAR